MNMVNFVVHMIHVFTRMMRMLIAYMGILRHHLFLPMTVMIVTVVMVILFGPYPSIKDKCGKV